MGGNGNRFEEMADVTNIKGKVNKIVFRNEDNGYTVASVSSEGTDVKVIGIMPLLRDGLEYSFAGGMVTNKYGVNFKAESYEEIVPTKEDDIIKYLGSGLVKGIGRTKAEAIVAHFGADSLRIVDEEPRRLIEVSGIGKKNILMIIESLEEQRAIRSIMLFLKSFDLPNAIAKRIYGKYGAESVSVLKQNPYRLADEVDYIGFKKADEVAHRMGFDDASPFRIRCGIVYALRMAVDEGNTFLPADVLVKCAMSSSVLSYDDADAVAHQLDLMVASGRLVTDDNGIYLPWIHEAECSISRRLVEIAARGRWFGEEEKVDFDELEKTSGVNYNEQQREAVALSAGGGVLVLTGGPGTGKTVTTRAVIELAEKKGRTILLAAPTGRAAKRMTEVTGRQSMTIHRLLEYGFGGFGRNADNPLEGDLLLVDEASMVDVPLMAALLSAVPDGMGVMLVGDIDQLPSVGCGNVLSDIIGSGAAPTVRLTQIYRQAAESAIVTNAHLINKGAMPSLENTRDFGMYATSDRDETRQTVLRLVKRYADNGKELQVLTPMRRAGDPIGATELNREIQQLVNPEGASLVRGLVTFRVGDRVMQMKNDYSADVFNGDVGVVVSVNARERKMLVRFDGEKDVEYGSDNIGMLDLAYATTVHKSQGSEYPYVVVVMDTSHSIMLQRNLLYTAVTRAKDRCIVVGSAKAVGMAVSCTKAVKRYSSLKERIVRETYRESSLF